MQYLALIYTEEAEEPNVDPMADTQTYEAYNRFTAEAERRGVMRAGEALQPTSSATTVRVRDGQTITTDGPFAETKEALGGFYILDCKDLDEAIELAAMIPGAAIGSVEVRPIVDFAQAG